MEIINKSNLKYSSQLEGGSGGERVAPNSLRGIDAHQHFWKYDAIKHSWIDDEMAGIRKDFLPQHLLPILLNNGIAGCVAVQADQTEAETNFLLSLASENEFIKGVVGWVDLRADNIQQRLEYYSQFKPLKGFRHILQGEDPSFMLQASFLNGIAQLTKHKYTYDILIYPKHLESVLHLVQQFPDQPFIVDHLAKPYIKAGLIDDWEKGMMALAKQPNVYCKVSGMVTEADYKQWKSTDFTPYVDVVVAAFGMDRLLFGSDWPVCEVAASYQQMMGIVYNYFSNFSQLEQEKFYRLNALKFYNL